jgi:glycosyltransferase involved in cell wall biosynthesis
LDVIFATNQQNPVKVLILTHRIPFPQNGGYPIVVCNTIKGLLDLGHEVSLFALNAKQHAHYQEDDGYESKSLISRINYKTYPINIGISMYEAALNLFNSEAQYVDRFYNHGFEKMLIEELKTQHYDIIQFEGLFVAPYLNAASKHSQAKLIYRSHNVEHQVWQRLAVQKGDPFKKWYLKLMASRIKKFELHQLNRFDAIIVFTDQDKATILECDIKPQINILPVGLDMARYHPDYSYTEFPSLFFLGSLDWMPNREGIQWFLNTFYHDLTTGELNVRFYVAGNDIPEQFDDYDVMGKIYIQGEVDDALEFVNSKSIMIVPLLSSGGMRVKIVEGMAMQKCIIATSLGAEGINYTHGENIMIANTRDEFYNCIRKCIKDEEFCKRIGANARKLVEDVHDVKVVTNKLVAFYQQVLNG